jgi:hypothetical protein
MVVQMTSADHKLATGFYEFAVFTIADWQAKLNRGMDVLDFTVPCAFLDQRPGVFQALFSAFCEALPTIHGHAGFAVNVPPMGRDANEASEYFFARRYGPGIDVGDPMGVSTVDLIGKIKTVDWIVALDSGLVRAAGGASSLTLPPDWYVRQPLGEGGLIVQAGAAPQSGISAGPGKPPLPPPAYVLLNAALRPIVADKMESSSLMHSPWINNCPTPVYTSVVRAEVLTSNRSTLDVATTARSMACAFWLSPPPLSRASRARTIAPCSTVRLPPPCPLVLTSPEYSSK